MPASTPSALNEMAGYLYYTADTTLNGVWEGQIKVEDQKIPVTMTIDSKQIVLDYTDFTLRSFLPKTNRFRIKVYCFTAW